MMTIQSPPKLTGLLLLIYSYTELCLYIIYALLEDTPREGENQMLKRHLKSANSIPYWLGTGGFSRATCCI